MSDPIAQPGTPPAVALNPDVPAEHMIPKSRFDEVNTRLRELEAEKAKRDQSERAAADKAAAERGEWERLAGERQARLDAAESLSATAAERITAYEAEMERQYKARVKELPQEIRDMEPEGDALSRFAWIPKAEAAALKLAATRTPGTPSGPRGTGAAPAPYSTADLVAHKRASGGYDM